MYLRAVGTWGIAYLHEGKLKLSKMACETGQWLGPASDFGAASGALRMRLSQWLVGSLEPVAPMQEHREPWAWLREVATWLWGGVEFLRFTSFMTLCRKPLRCDEVCGYLLRSQVPSFPLLHCHMESHHLPETFPRRSCSNFRHLWFPLTPPFINSQRMRMLPFVPQDKM